MCACTGQEAAGKRAAAPSRASVSRAAAGRELMLACTAGAGCAQERGPREACSGGGRGRVEQEATGPAKRAGRERGEEGERKKEEKKREKEKENGKREREGKREKFAPRSRRRSRSRSVAFRGRPRALTRPQGKGVEMLEIGRLEQGKIPGFRADFELNDGTLGFENNYRTI